mmetsp:Transcript_13332/g.28251  ORF Transcript_13332/g.28251 Transcript_13332/m.28251 type:complete len:328 (+) Transcript_13332:94-1077(+)
MAISSRRKRKVYGVVRDLDEDFMQQRNDTDGSKNTDDQTDNNSSSSSIDDRDSCDNYSDCESDGNDDEDYNDEKKEDTKIDNGKKKKKNESKSSSVEKKRKNSPKKDESITNKKKKTSPTKRSRMHVENKKDVAIKVESNDDNKDTTSSVQKKKWKIDADSFDVILPSSILNGGGGSSINECTLLVEVSDLKDAIALGEFGGSVGAIGRFESDPEGITLDLKGNQYRGSLLPGPTCLVVGFPQSFGAKKKELTSTGANGQQGHEEEAVVEEEGMPSVGGGKLRVEGIADEYATLIQIDDHMKKLDAVVTGNHDDGNNENTDFAGNKK